MRSNIAAAAAVVVVISAVTVAFTACEARPSSLKVTAIVSEEEARGFVADGPVDVILHIRVSGEPRTGPLGARPTEPIVLGDVTRRAGVLCDGDAIFEVLVGDDVLGLEQCITAAELDVFLLPADAEAPCGARLAPEDVGLPGGDPALSLQNDFVDVVVGDDDCTVSGAATVDVR